MAANMTVVTNILNGRRVGRFANRKTLGNDETIQEAIDGGYVVGKKEIIGTTAKGVLRGMVVGIQKDGNGRKINEFISLQPYAKCHLDDPTDPVTKDNCKVRVVARALKELQPDTSNWSFAIEGASADTLNITSVTTGEVIGEIVVGENVDFNGFGLAMGEGDTLRWSVPGTEKSGTVADAKIESSWTRLTVTGDALAELASAEYNGKMIAFVLKVGNATVSKSATLKVA